MNYFTLGSRCLCRAVYAVRSSRHIDLVKRRFSGKNAAAEELFKTNPYYKKYAKKIEELQNASPAEFEERLKDTPSMKKKKKSASDHPDHKSNVAGPITEGAMAKAMSSRSKSKEEIPSKPTYTPKKTLDSLMKVEMLLDKTPEEITTIWQDFHKNRKGIYAVVPADVHDTIERRASDFPTFVFPIPRKTGFEFIMSQFSGQECHFTPLISYQAYAENAPVCLTIIHYPELKQDKGIVLMCGEYDENVIGAPEAQCLANQLQMYYGGQELKKKILLWTFTNEPHAFKHADLIEELERSLSK